MVILKEYFVSSPTGLSLTEGRPRSPLISMPWFLAESSKMINLLGRYAGAGIPPSLPHFHRCHRTNIPGKTIGTLTHRSESSLMSQLWQSKEKNRSAVAPAAVAPVYYQSSRSQKKIKAYRSGMSLPRTAASAYRPRRTERAPPLPAIMRFELEDTYDWGDFPPDKAYFCDAQWGL